jgi:hypothetical protein
MPDKAEPLTAYERECRISCPSGCGNSYGIVGYQSPSLRPESLREGCEFCDCGTLIAHHHIASPAFGAMPIRCTAPTLENFAEQQARRVQELEGGTQCQMTEK